MVVSSGSCFRYFPVGKTFPVTNLLVLSNFYWLNSKNVSELFLYYVMHGEYIYQWVRCQKREEKMGGKKTTEETSEKREEFEGKDQDAYKEGDSLLLRQKKS